MWRILEVSRPHVPLNPKNPNVSPGTPQEGGYTLRCPSPMEQAAYGTLLQLVVGPQQHWHPKSLPFPLVADFQPALGYQA